MVEERHAKHLLVADAETGAISEALRWGDGQVGADRPVEAKRQRHHQQQSGVAQFGEADQKQPEGGGGLLHLNVSGGEQRPHFGIALEADNENVENKGEQQQRQDGAE